jgi:hypothetical protein
METPKSPFVPAKEAYKATPLCERTFHSLVKKGFFPSYKINGRRYFKIDEIIATIERQRISSRDETLS